MNGFACAVSRWPLAAILALIVSGPLVAADLDETRLAAIGKRMQQFVEAGELAGAVTVVGTSRGVAHLEAVGHRSLNPADPMQRDTLFRIASMTKPITAVGIQILAQEGKLAVTDPVEKYLPEFRGQMLISERGKNRLVLVPPARPITLRDLLTHTSGLAAYPPGLADLYQKRHYSLAEATLAVSQRPLEYEPGSRWSYNNPGIDTLGRIIEAVSGTSYEDFLTQRIFKPLGMKDTTVRPDSTQQQRIAEVYARQNGKLVPEKSLLIGAPERSRHPIPAGGLYSTGPDMARFYRMMLSGGSLDGQRILSPQSVAEMTRVHTGDLKCGFTPGMGFGHGFAVVRQPEGITARLSPGTFGHGGAFGTQSWADPKRDLFVILLIARTGIKNGDASEYRAELQRLALDAVKGK